MLFAVSHQRSDALAAIAQLAPAQQAELYAIAARGPVGMRLAPDAPMYRMQLVRAYHVMIAKRVPTMTDATSTDLR